MPPQPGTEDHHQMLNKYRFFRESFYLVGKYIHQGIGQNTSRKANPTSGEVGQMKETLGQQDAYRHGNDETSRRGYADKFLLNVLCKVLVCVEN